MRFVRKLNLHQRKASFSKLEKQLLFYRFHNDAQIPNEASSSLRLSSVSQADVGSYKCSAKNEYGAVFSSKAELTVMDGKVMLMDTRIYRMLKLV